MTKDPTLIDPSNAGVGRGLDVSRPDDLTEEERESYNAIEIATRGHLHQGWEFWLQNRPEVFKRYRAFTDRIPQKGGLEGAQSYGFLAMYILRGYLVGIRYLVKGLQRNGLTKEQVVEALAVCFLDSIMAPVGMETVTAALTGYEWIAPARRPTFPQGWSHDPEAFRSGVDFRSPGTSPADAALIVKWYERTLGEVPGWVRLYARERPDLLKRYRDRFEHALVTLPKQIVPLVMIMSSVERNLAEGIREGVLLAKAFGMTRAQTIEAICQGALKGGIQQASVAEAAAGEILKSWK